MTGLGQQSSRPVEQKQSASFEDSQDPYEFNDEELAIMKGKMDNKNKKLLEEVLRFRLDAEV